MQISGATNSYTAAIQSKDQPGESSKSISLLDDDVVNITYKYKIQTGEIAGIENPPKSLAASFLGGSSQNIQQYKNYFSQQAITKDTKALIRVGDEVVAMYSQDGSVTSRNNIQGLINQAGGDLNALNDLLKDKYGQNFSIETFEPGEGPTGTEAFEMFNGFSLSEFVNRQVKLMESSFQQSILQAEEQQMQKLLYEQVPQSAVFTVGGAIVGSINEQGYVDINANILKQTDAKGQDRESIKDFYSYKKMHDSDSQTIESMLREVFGDDVKVEQFNQDNMPLLGEVRAKANAKLLPI